MNSERKIFAVILAGGSGTRFWPASRRLRPKQLLPLGPCAPHSLISSTVERLEGLIAAENILVATGEHLMESTKNELKVLNDDSFLAEPQARNTAPCIGWAAALIAAKDPDAVVVVLPSDQHARDSAEFRRVVSRATKAAAEGYITTIGIVPTRPETGYGYIRQGAEKTPNTFEVAGFFEKPSLSKAQEYLEDGNFLWNAGIFVFRASDMLDAFARHLPQMAAELEIVAAKRGTQEEKQSVVDFFKNCESISIDYGIMEKESQLRVVPGEFGWSDLGSWESSWELSPKDETGNAAAPGTIFVDAKNNLVEDLRTPQSEDTKRKNKVIAMVGVDDLCVVETDDALLIMPRSRAQDVRDVVAELKATDRQDLT